MRLSNQIVLASMNSGKFREFQALLKTYPEIELLPVEGLIRNPEKLALVENHETYLENAIAKARIANQACHYPVLADDTGLEVDALGRKPGIQSRRYARLTSKNFHSQITQDQANIELLLKELQAVPLAQRTAKFVTALVLVIEGLLIHAEGILTGTLAEAPRGEYGFGYDSIFIPQGSQKTLAEMSEQEKNTLSHRAQAIRELMLRIHNRGIVFVKP